MGSVHSLNARCPISELASTHTHLLSSTHSIPSRHDVPRTQRCRQLSRLQPSRYKKAKPAIVAISTHPIEALRT